MSGRITSREILGRRSRSALARRAAAGRADAVDQPARCARGDQAAFAALYESTAAQVFGLVQAMISDRHAAEHLTTQVYCQVWHAAGEDTVNLEEMRVRLLATAHRDAVEYLRAHHDAENPQTSSPPALWARVRLLDPLSRELVELVYLRGRTCPQAASLLGLSPQAAYVALRAALLTLSQPSATGPAH
jgi:RNA polymerase sigma-70 factor, ECF subfamily